MADQIAGRGVENARPGKCRTIQQGGMPDLENGGPMWTGILRDWKMQDLSSRAVDGHQMYSGRK